MYYLSLLDWLIDWLIKKHFLFIDLFILIIEKKVFYLSLFDWFEWLIDWFLFFGGTSGRNKNAWLALDTVELSFWWAPLRSVYTLFQNPKPTFSRPPSARLSISPLFSPQLWTSAPPLPPPTPTPPLWVCRSWYICLCTFLFLSVRLLALVRTIINYVCARSAYIYSGSYGKSHHALEISPKAEIGFSLLLLQRLWYCWRTSFLEDLS